MPVVDLVKIRELFDLTERVDDTESVLCGMPIVG